MAALHPVHLVVTLLAAVPVILLVTLLVLVPVILPVMLLAAALVHHQVICLMCLLLTLLPRLLVLIIVICCLPIHSIGDAYMTSLHPGHLLAPLPLIHQVKHQAALPVMSQVSVLDPVLLLIQEYLQVDLQAVTVVHHQAIPLVCLLLTVLLLLQVHQVIAPVLV